VKKKKKEKAEFFENFEFLGEKLRPPLKFKRGVLITLRESHTVNGRVPERVLHEKKIAIIAIAILKF